MSKNFNQKFINPVKLLSEHTNRKGKLKGTKKEKKYLKCACPHHTYNRKGKMKATIEHDGSGNCRCFMCGDIIPLKFANDSDLQKSTDQFYKNVTQCKLMVQSVGAGKEAVQQVTETAIAVKQFPKLYKNVRNAVQKRDKIKKNKKKNHTRNTSFGGWGSGRY